MSGSPNIAKIGALLGDNTRARILSALMHGKALTAAELAREANVTPQTASTHLAKLTDGGLISLTKQGRHKYFLLASHKIADLLETIMGLTAGNEPLRTVTGPRDQALREARVCYNHLAGERGIELYDALIDCRYLRTLDGNLSVTTKGRSFFEGFGIDLNQLKSARTPLCRSCLDWSERKTHLAGSLGRALFTRFEQLHWVKRDNTSRIVTFTTKGKRAFTSTFCVDSSS